MKTVHDSSENTESLRLVNPAFVIPPPSGNLLANVRPPSSLPDLQILKSVIAHITPPADVPNSIVTNVSQGQFPALQTQPSINPLQLPESEQFPSTQFSAAIPPSKGVQLGPTAPQKVPDKDSSGGFMSYFKEAFTGGGVLAKMAEKAKSSVDTIITTLDPQMSEYINSEGETEITVTSDKEDEVSAVREAFHSVFGKAWVNGIKLNFPEKKYQAIGFKMGRQNAEESIKESIKVRNTPTVALESILFQENNEWFDITLLLLKDTDKKITIQTFSQATPVPEDEFLKNVISEMPYSKFWSVEEKLALYAYEKNKWQQHISGVSRKEVIFLAAKTLVRIYKNKLSSIQ